MKDLSILRSQMCKIALMSISAGYLTSAIQAHAAPNHLQGYVLDVQMTPAICSMDSNRNKQRRCLEGYSLTINGLLPETDQKDCSTHSSPKLSPLQEKTVARVMPEETIRNRLWYSIGGCIPMNASQYFRNMINKAENLKVPSDLTGTGNKTVQQHALINQFVRMNPKMSSENIRLSCNGRSSKAMLTGIKICYKVNGQYKQCSTQIVSNCPTTFSIKGSY